MCRENGEESVSGVKLVGEGLLARWDRIRSRQTALGRRSLGTSAFRGCNLRFSKHYERHGRIAIPLVILERWRCIERRDGDLVGRGNDPFENGRTGILGSAVVKIFAI